MENQTDRELKRLARLKYQDHIYREHLAGRSIREIADRINYRLARTNLKTTLSKSTIGEIIKFKKEKAHD